MSLVCNVKSYFITIVFEVKRVVNLKSFEHKYLCYVKKGQLWLLFCDVYLNGSMQKRRNFIANALG